MLNDTKTTCMRLVCPWDRVNDMPFVPALQTSMQVPISVEMHVFKYVSMQDPSSICCAGTLTEEVGQDSPLGRPVDR